MRWTVLISVDPGINGCGVAYFIGDKLVKAMYVKNPAKKDILPGYRAFSMAQAVIGTKAEPWNDQLVLEYPQIYRGPRANNPNNLLTLALVDGALMGLFGNHAILYLPHAWKGSVDPDVCVARVQARLSAAEMGQVELPAASLAHNVWDAIGIGLFHLGRFNPRRVYAAS